MFYKKHCMKQHFTQDHLIRFIYKETSAAESLAISEAIGSDPVLQDEYEDLLEMHGQLPQVRFNPSGKTIRKILNYSAHKTLETQH